MVLHILLTAAVVGPLAQVRPTARLVPQTGHACPLDSVAVSPDGRLVLTGGADQKAQLWDAQSGAAIVTYVGHEGPGGVEFVAFLPGGREIVTAGGDRTIRFWDTATGKEKRKFGAEEGWSSPIVISPDEATVVAGDEEGNLAVLDMASGKVQRRLSVEGMIVEAAISPNSREIAIATFDGDVVVCDFQTGATKRTLVGHEDSINSVEYSADGSKLLTAGYDETVRIWSAQTGQQVLKQPVPTEGLLFAKFSPDAKTILTLGGNSPKIWDSTTGKERASLDGHIDVVMHAAYFPDGGKIVTAGSDWTARIWDAESSVELARLFPFAPPVFASVLAQSPNRLVIGGIDGICRILQIDEGGRILELRGHEAPIVDAHFSPDQRNLVTAGVDGTAIVWDAADGSRKFVLSGHTDGVQSARYSHDGTRILTSSADGSARIWNSQTGKSELTLLKETVDAGGLLSAEFSPDDDHVVTATDFGVVIWNSRTGAVEQRMENRDELTLFSVLPISSAVYSPSGTRIASVNAFSAGRVWDAATGAELFRLEGDSSSDTSVAYSPDGKRIAACGLDGPIRLFDAETGKLLLELTGHTGTINRVSFSDDGTRLVSAGMDGTCRIWDATSGAEVCTAMFDLEGGWVVATPDNRFDTGDLNWVPGVHWVASDQPFTPLGVEVFMRQYFEPKLLTRLFRGERLPEVKSIAQLNRVQPKLQILSVVRDRANDTATIRIEVTRGKEAFERDGSRVEVETSANDLRVFRNGRLIRHVEGNLIEGGVESKTFVLDDIPLRTRPELSEVLFTAYCFNDDDVKSETAAYILDVPPSAVARKPRVFAICFGADDYDGEAVRDLKYAAADAKAFQKTFMSAFTNHAGIEQVVSLSFVSEAEGAKQATKENFKAALDLLCGRQVSSEVLERAPDLKKLTKATPDDIVIVTFSGHGVSGDDGKFYLVPSNIKSKETLREDSISSDELSEWFRDLDALEMAFILDACHSAKAIEQEGFKPGPMGARGLGQLAYDKGMLVLAATQAEDVALEVNKLQHGLLTYALVEDGYIAGKAKDDQGLLTLQGWLKYAESRVPEIYAALAKGEDIRSEDGRAVIFSGSTASMKTREDLQRPSLFDFLKTRPQIEMVQATTGDVWTPIWGLFVNNASVLSDGAAFDEAVVEFWRRVVMSSIAWSRRSA